MQGMGPIDIIWPLDIPAEVSPPLPLFVPSVNKKFENFYDPLLKNFKKVPPHTHTHTIFGRAHVLSYQS